MMRIFSVIPAALAFAAFGMKTPPSSASVSLDGRVRSGTIDYSHVGESKHKENHGKGFGKGCLFDDDGLFTDQCEGYPEEAFPGDPSKNALPRWLRSRDWHKYSTTSPRDAGGGVQVTRTVRAIVGPENYALKRLKDRGLVVARLTGDPTSPKDVRYGIGGWSAQDGYGDHFYFVVDNVDLNQQGDATSRPVAKWKLYGVQRGRLASIKGGTLRWCGKDHSDQLKVWGSSFIKCERVGPLAELVARTQLSSKIGKTSLLESIRGNLVLAQAADTARLQIAGRVRTWAAQNNLQLTSADMQLLEDIIIEEPFAPVWVVCGIGCCTTDDS